MTDTQENIRQFATISELHEDGVSLIFDGEEEASQKHYLCNTSVYFAPGDRVRLLAENDTYIVEYVVGAPKQSPDSGIPSGGSTGHALLKSSAADGDVGWGFPRANSIRNRNNLNSAYDIEFLYDGYLYFRVGSSGTWRRITIT